MTSFFICDDDWEKEKEVTLEEMDDNPEIDSWVMKDTQVSELVEDEKQKLLYVFDYMTERCFFIELSEIITGKNMTGAKCTKKAGEAPKQTVDFEEMAGLPAARSTWTKVSTATRTSTWKTSIKKDSAVWTMEPQVLLTKTTNSDKPVRANSTCSNDNETSLEDTFVSKDAIVFRPNYFVAIS